MEETNEKPQEKVESNPSADGGDKSETPAPIVEANAAAKRMEDANIERAKILEREEALEARKALGGRADAGGQPIKPKEETAEEKAERFERGEMDILKEGDGKKED